MANTEVWGKRFLQVTLDASGDWRCGDPTNTGSGERPIRPKSLIFFPSAANDVLIVREGSITGPIMAKLIALAAEQQGLYFNGDESVVPVIDYSECTFSTPASAVITFEFA